MVFWFRENSEIIISYLIYVLRFIWIHLLKFYSFLCATQTLHEHEHEQSVIQSVCAQEIDRNHLIYHLLSQQIWCIFFKCVYMTSKLHFNELIIGIFCTCCTKLKDIAFESIRWSDRPIVTEVQLNFAKQFSAQ